MDEKGNLAVRVLIDHLNHIFVSFSIINTSTSAAATSNRGLETREEKKKKAPARMHLMSGLIPQI